MERYYIYLKDYIQGADLVVGKIYSSNYYPIDFNGNEGALCVAVYVENCRYFGINGNWKEVSEEEYLNKNN